MRLLSIALCLAALLAARPADACRITNQPTATLLAADQGRAGLQPWIATWHLPATPVLTAVASSCKARTRCRGTTVAIERGTGYLRPAAPLQPGQRYQLAVKQQLLLDFTTTDVDVVPALAAWDGLTVTSAAVERARTTCGFEGLVVRATVKQWTKHAAGLSRHLVLLYTQQPDVTAPTRGLGRIVTLADRADLELVTNSVGGNWVGKKQPLWAVLTDAHGHLGAPIALAMP